MKTYNRYRGTENNKNTRKLITDIKAQKIIKTHENL